MTGLAATRMLESSRQRPPKNQSYFEEESAPRGSIAPAPKEFPEQDGGLTLEKVPPPRKSANREFFVDEDGIGTIQPDPGDGSNEGRERGSDDDDPDMPEI